MANIWIVGRSQSKNADGSVGLSIALELRDGEVKIPARFSIDTSDEALPIVGITEYGKLVTIIGEGDATRTINITATPLDGGEAVTIANKTLATLRTTTIPSALT